MDYITEQRNNNNNSSSSSSSLISPSTPPRSAIASTIIASPRLIYPASIHAVGASGLLPIQTIQLSEESYESDSTTTIPLASKEPTRPVTHDCEIFTNKDQLSVLHRLLTSVDLNYITIEIGTINLPLFTARNTGDISTITNWVEQVKIALKSVNIWKLLVNKFSTITANINKLIGATITYSTIGKETVSILVDQSYTNGVIKYVYDNITKLYNVLARTLTGELLVYSNIKYEQQSSELQSLFIEGNVNYLWRKLISTD